MIYLGTSTNGEPRLVPVARPALPYLQAIPFERTIGSLDKEERKVRKALGILHIRHHDLRHTPASLLANAGVPLFTLGRILGQSATYTQERYSHLYVKTLRAAVAKIREAGDI